MKMDETQGKRLRYVRSLCGLKRNEFVAKYNLSLATVRSWELDLTRISDKFCDKLVEIYKKEDIIVSKEWIISGIPPQPIKISNDNANNQIQTLNTLKKEIDFFLTLSEKNQIYTCKQNYFYPFIEKNDILGIEEISYDDLMKTESSLIVINKESPNLLITAKDQNNNLVASNLYFTNSKNKTIIELEKNKTYFLIKWIRKNQL